MEGFTRTFFPELGNQIEKKIQGVYSLNQNNIIISKDQTFASDTHGVEIIPDKGRIYTQLILFWFEKTKEIMQNHIVFSPDPNVMITKKYQSIPLEIVVRKYIQGKESQELKTPIVTPILNTANGWQSVAKEQILRDKIVDDKIYFEMENKALLLFQKGEELLQKNKVVLAEAKYQFGIGERGELMLVDQIHTPDSARMWLAEDVHKKPMQFPDREQIKLDQEGCLSIKEPREIQKKMRDGYIQIFKTLTAQKFTLSALPADQRVLTRLKNAKIIQGFFISILTSCEDDRSYIEKITKTFNEKKIPYQITVIKSVEQLEDHLKLFNQSLEPVVYIMVEGKEFTFAKKGALESAWPVICTASFAMDPIDSSILHTKVPVLTVQAPTNVAGSAIKLLQSLEG